MGYVKWGILFLLLIASASAAPCDFSYNEIVLNSDMDCSGVAITPRDTSYFYLHGNGHTIHNLKIEGGDYTGIIGTAGNVEMYDVTFKNLQIKGNSYVGLVGKTGTAIFDGVVVEGVVEGVSQVGAFAGYAESASVRRSDFRDGNCEPNWECTEWSECTDSQRTRECKDLNGCGIDVPDTQTSCFVITADAIAIDSEDPWTYGAVGIAVLFVVLLYLSTYASKIRRVEKLISKGKTEKAQKTYLKAQKKYGKMKPKRQQKEYSRLYSAYTGLKDL